ncbi:hypothetical protein BGZ83_001792, partial [Gryganskiella cystojenkinii]
KPVATDKPTSAERPVPTEKTTDKPVPTDKPVATDKPTSAERTVPTDNTMDKPVTTNKPVATDKPISTEKPIPTDKTTDKPVSTDKPVTTDRPISTEKPVPTVKTTEKPVPTVTTTDMPVPTETPVATDNPLSQDDITAILKAHNDLRALHSSPALVWDDKLAAFGDNWIQKCEFEHSNGPYGENLAAGHSDFPSAIKDWYDEIKDYDFNNPGLSGKTGHFTQVVWKATTSVGCAVKKCPDWPLYICNYQPPGNMKYNGGYSLYIANVLPKK